MPRNRRLFLHGEVRMVGFRALTGLPLPATAPVIEVMKGCLARSLELYGGYIGDIIFMSNHVHFFLLIDDPARADLLIRHFKTESAHAINRMMGKLKGPVWEEGYDAPLILDIYKYIEKAAYMLTNPQEAGLTSTIEEYPHISSWREMNKEEVSYQCLRFRRREVPKLPKGEIDIRSGRRLRAKLKAKCGKRGRVPLKFSFYRIYEALKDEDTGMSYAEFRQEIHREVRRIEGVYRRERQEQGRGVVGKERLQEASIHREHEPKKHGRRMLCLGSCAEQRKRYIAVYRWWVAQCREVFQSWQQGARNVEFPPGFFPPGGGRPVASMLPGGFWE